MRGVKYSDLAETKELRNMGRCSFDGRFDCKSVSVCGY